MCLTTIFCALRRCAVPPDGDTTSCNIVFPNSSFSLAPLIINTFYSVKDTRNNQDQTNYTYFFNVCRNVNRDPTWLRAYPACSQTYNTGTSPQSEAAVGVATLATSAQRHAP